jgi:phosphotransferase system  glucose/maltose/N-acetylglucosamine-specific IIC component
MTGDISTLFRKEIELAKIEIKDDVRQTAKAGGLFGAAGFAGYMLAVMLSFALAFLLDLIMPTWVAFLIVGVLYGVGGYLLFRRAKERFKRITPGPEQTIETIKEDVEWIKARKR